MNAAAARRSLRAALLITRREVRDQLRDWRIIVPILTLTLIFALESFVGEKERHSLEPLLASPVSDTELYVGKTLAAMLPPLLAAYLGIAVYLAGLAITVGWRPNPILLIQILALTTIQALVMVAGAVVISAQTTSVR